QLSPRYPRLAFSIIQAPTIASQFSYLRERSVDLIFGRLILPIEDEDLGTDILFEDRYVVISGEGSKWLRRQHIHLAQLVDEPWCLNPGHLEADVIAAFHAKGLAAPKQVVMTNSNQLKHALVAAGDFLSATSASRLRLSKKRLGLRPLKTDLAIPSTHIGLVTLTGRMLSPAAQLFIDGARRVTRPFANKNNRMHPSDVAN